MILFTLRVYILVAPLIVYGGGGWDRRGQDRKERLDVARAMNATANTNLTALSPVLDVFPLMNLMNSTEQNILKDIHWNIESPQQLLQKMNALNTESAETNGKLLTTINMLLTTPDSYTNTSDAVEESITYVNNTIAVQNHLPDILNIANECIDQLVIKGNETQLQSTNRKRLESIQSEIHTNVTNLQEIWRKLKERQDAIGRLALQFGNVIKFSVSIFSYFSFFFYVFFLFG